MIAEASPLGVPDVVLAIVAAVPATIAAIAAWWNAKATKHQTTPSNGGRLAETIEETREDVRDMKADFRDHKNTPARQAHRER